MRRLSGIRRRRAVPEPAPHDEVVAAATPASPARSRSAGVDYVYHLPPHAPPSPARARQNEPEGAGWRPPAERWRPPAVLVAPPPFRTLETTRGPVLVRRMSVPLAPALARVLARDESHRRRVERRGASLILDTETTGLGSSMLFLVGLAWLEPGGIAIEQIYAEDHSREGALLCRVVHHLAGAGRLVTFNGRSYDLPLIRDRAVRHRLSPWPAIADVDLLTLARRRWRKRLPDCKLTTIETLVLGRRRHADVDGRAIPALYQRSVRTRDRRLIAPVLFHNALDLLTTAELMARLDPAGADAGANDAAAAGGDGGAESERAVGGERGDGEAAPGGEDAPGPSRRCSDRLD